MAMGKFSHRLHFHIFNRLSGTIDAYLGQYQTPMMELFLGKL